MTQQTVPQISLLDAIMPGLSKPNAVPTAMNEAQAALQMLLSGSTTPPIGQGQPGDGGVNPAVADIPTGNPSEGTQNLGIPPLLQQTRPELSNGVPQVTGVPSPNATYIPGEGMPFPYRIHEAVASPEQAVVPEQVPVQVPAPAGGSVSYKESGTVPSPIDTAIYELPEGDELLPELEALKEFNPTTPEEAKGFWEKNPGAGMAMMQVGVALASGGDVNKALQQGFAGMRSDLRNRKNDQRADRQEQLVERQMELKEWDSKNASIHRQNLQTLKKNNLDATVAMFNTGEENKNARTSYQLQQNLLMKQLSNSSDEDLGFKPSDAINLAKAQKDPISDGAGGFTAPAISVMDIYSAGNTLRKNIGKAPLIHTPTAAIDANTLKAVRREGITEPEQELIIKQYSEVFGYDNAVSLFQKVKRASLEE